MLSLLIKTGGIRDVGLGLHWDAPTLANEIAHRVAVLSRMGIGRGAMVAIAHSGSARFFADLLATWTVGAAAVCLDPTLTPGELRTVVEFAKSRVLLVDGAISAGRSLVPIVDLASESAEILSNPVPVFELDDLALVLFTSGTTGAPKGVALSFRALQARIDANIAAIGTAALARTLVSLPTHFGHGLIGNSLTPLLAGGDLVLHPLGIAMANDLGSIIDEHGITFMSSVPALWRLALSRSRPPANCSLLRVHVGSAPLSAGLWSEIACWSNAEVVNCYGTTETANWIGGASSRDGIAEGFVGKLWGGRAAVLDEGGSIHHAGTGEIVIQSPSLMSGYLYRPDLTRAALEQGWYRTGDRGSIDPQGRVWLMGRIKDEINRAGFKVQPAEIDALLESNPAIAEACVFGISDPLGGEAVAAAVRPRRDADVSPQILQAWCLARVRREAVPEQWFFVSEIPRTARGKVSRDAVRRMLVKETVVGAGEPEGATPVPGDLAEPVTAGRNVRAAVEQAWCEILGRNSCAAEVPLTEAGADSLDSLRIWFLIEKILGVRLSMGGVLESDPTPGQLTTALEQQLRELPGRPALRPSAAGAPLVFLLPPAGGDLPMLASFRTAFRDRIRFSVVKYPGWREMIDANAGFDALVEAAVAQICSQTRHDDDCLLAGYSFGGLVAVETARRLIERGRRIGFLGLLDTRVFNPSEVAKPRPQIGSAKALASAHRPDKIIGRVISGLILMSAYRPLKMIGRLSSWLPVKWGFTIEFMLNFRLRSRSLARLKLTPLQVPITLYRPDSGSSVPSDNGWSAYCSKLTVVPVGGTHHSMLTAPFVGELCARFTEAVESIDLHPGHAAAPSDLREARVTENSPGVESGLADRRAKVSIGQ
jgi:oxalate---CoA ligase